MSHRLSHFVLILLSTFCPVRSAAAQDEPRSAPLTHAQSVQSVYQHQDGSIWIGTNFAGAFRYDGKAFTHYSMEDGLVSNYVASITADHEGRVWFGTNKGLSRFDGKEFQSVAIPWDGNEDLWGKGMNANLVLCLLTDRTGRIWFGTWGNGAHSFDPTEANEAGQYEFTSVLQNRGKLYGAGEHRNVIQNIMEAADGSIWFASMSHGGATQWKDGMFQSRTMEHGLSENMVFSVYQARDGDVWLGMLGNRKRGLNRLSGKEVQTFGEADGLSSNNIVDIHEDRDGVFWLGSQRGKLSTLKPANSSDDRVQAQVFEHDGRSFSQIHLVTGDAKGNLWLGGGYGQLYRYDGKKLVDFRAELSKARQ